MSQSNKDRSAAGTVCTEKLSPGWTVGFRVQIGIVRMGLDQESKMYLSSAVSSKLTLKHPNCLCLFGFFNGVCGVVDAGDGLEKDARRARSKQDLKGLFSCYGHP